VASDPSIVEHICDQMSGAGRIAFKKMFGDYTVYCDDKVVALICDNQLFVKPTSAGRSAIGTVVEAPPYEGAKPSFLIEDKLDDREWLSSLIRVTAAELPLPKPKKPKVKTTG